MKIRNSYVSNSSSSSFLVVGYLIDDENGEKFFKIAKKVNPSMKDYSTVEDMMNENGGSIRNNDIIVRIGNNDNGIQKGKTVVGKNFKIFDDDNYSIDDAIIEIDEIKNELKEVEDILDDNEKKMKIITGTNYY